MASRNLWTTPSASAYFPNTHFPRGIFTGRRMEEFEEEPFDGQSAKASISVCEVADFLLHFILSKEN